MSDDNEEKRSIKSYEEFISDLMGQIDPNYRRGFESLFKNALDREQAFEVVLLAVEEQINQVDTTELTELGVLKRNFRHLSNLSVLSQLIDICGLSLYKDKIIEERIRAIFGPKGK